MLVPAGLVWLAAAAPGPTVDPLAPPVAASSPAAAAQPVAALPGETGAHALTKEDIDSWLDGYLPFALSVDDIAGADVAVVKDGHILTERGYGYADVARRTPVDPDRTLFRPGSVSKLVTWTAVMQLVEQHKLDLDQDVNTYLDFHIPAFDGKPITLRQIMTHTAGFAERAKDISFYNPAYLQSLGDFLKAWTPARIFAAGTTPAYSNWATSLAGYIVQRVSNTPFDDYVEQHIFKPLDMHNSTFRQPLPAGLASQMATGYGQASQPAKRFEIIGPTPAGALSSTAGDMARFMIAHLQNGELNGTRILEPATAEMMHDSPLDRVDPTSLIPPLNRMELGFFETNINGHEVIGHLGDTENFHTILHLFIKDGVGLYVSFNSAGKGGSVQPLRGALFQDFADRYFPQTVPDGHVAADLAMQHARMMTGQWDASRKSAGTFLVSLSLLSQTTISTGPAGELVVSGLTDPSGAIRHWREIAPFVWRDVNGHDRLAAKLVDGKVVRWSWDLASPFEVMDRVPFGRSSVWLLPALMTSLAILLPGFLFWPVRWLLRRHYRASALPAGPLLLADRLSRLAAGLTLAVLIGWALTVSRMLFNPDALTRASDPILWTLQIGGLVVFVSAVLLSGWKTWLVWQPGHSWPGRKWPSRIWSILMLLSSLLVLYVATAFGLLSMTVHY
ncbi:beta-lactamase family protein [Lichenicola cladoniae]|uniref:Beta-lactamase family protein n=1 Tax=Lichenicola cladoniae TaxID=1484109 RepID=A0A6M8HQY4_9PROT|nr:serine hydrolase domain-containing protein [Lichenicola cladoniae]NPD69061.1 beta-lactamase family protein [Acetobacteraceae bacterium]QKE90889.1 beta-lactamase family protein [Lichenicola cladoniae]